MPVMSRPRKLTRPESGVSRPVIRLKNVVLPAPFGPMMACSPPEGSSKWTSSTARRPPKDLLRPSVLSTMPVTAGPPWQRSGRARSPLAVAGKKPLQQPDQSVGCIPHHEDHDRADCQQIVLPVDREFLTQHDQHSGAEHGPEQRTGAADDRPDHAFARNGPIQI